MPESVEILFRIKTEGQHQIDAAKRAVSGMSGELRSGNKVVAEFETAVRGANATARTAATLYDHLGRSIRTFGGAASVAAESAKTIDQSMTRSVVQGGILVSVFERLSGAAKAYTVGAATYAARTETMLVITGQLAHVNGLSRDAVLNQVQAVRQLGITQQEALNTVNRMIFAQLDVAKATDLARMAQDAARIAGTNSSEALQGIIHGIVTRQPEVLRTYGIVVDFEHEYTKAARERGRELTAVEKVQVAMNHVLADSVKITGVYAATLLTTGGRLQSLERHVDEAKGAIGEAFIPVLSRAVDWMTRLAKLAQTNSEAFASLTGTITGAGIAAALLSFTPLGRGAKIGGAILGGLAGGMAANVDPIESHAENARSAFASIEKQRKALNDLFKDGKVSADEYKRQFDAIDESLKTFRRSLAEVLVHEFDKKFKRGVLPIDTGVTGGFSPQERGGSFEKFLPDSQEIGGGVAAVTRQELLSARLDPSAKGTLFNQERFERELAEQLGEQSRTRAKARNEQLQRLLEQLDQKGLDPLAQLIHNTQASLEKIVRQFGALPDSAATTAALQGALRREIGKQRIEPIHSEIPGFIDSIGLLPVQAHGATVDPKHNEQAIAEFRERSLRAIARQVSFQERLMALTAGPGGEIDAVESIAALREDAARREFKITQDRALFDERTDQARKDRIIELAEIQKRRLEDYRDQAGRVFDALTARGGGGLKDFFAGQLKILERQVFVNASAGIFSKVGGTLGKVGAASGLGGLLQGTIFDPKNAQPIDKNTAATESNTKAVDRLSGMVSGSPSGIPGLPTGVFQGAGGPGGTIFSALPGSRGGAFGAGLSSLLGGGGLFAGLRGDSLQTAPGVATANTGAARAGNLVGSAAAVGAGALGVIGGIRQGGGRGATQAIGSALGVAATVPGPQQPFVMAGAMIAGFVASILPDPKMIREESIDRMIAAGRFSDPASIHRTIDIGGGEIDFDRRGRVRVTQVITVQVNAMDSKSFLDRRNDIAEAVRSAMRDGHDINDTMRAGLGVAA